MKELRHPIAPELSEENIARWRAMTPGERMEDGFRLTNEFFARMRADVQREYPEANENEIRARVAAKHLPRDLVMAAYRWDPDRQGFTQ